MTVLSLAGGVSLGPENPIIAINVGIIVALFARLLPQVPTQISVLIAGAATVGALFGTPVAAALLFTGIVAAAKGGGSLWDRLFLPVAAAGAGAITMHLLGAPPLAFDLPPYGSPQAIDLLTGALVACGAVVDQPRRARRVPHRLARVARAAPPDPHPARRRLPARHPRPHRRPDHDVQGPRADRRAAAGPRRVRRHPARRDRRHQDPRPAGGGRRPLPRRPHLPGHLHRGRPRHARPRADPRASRSGWRWRAASSASSSSSAATDGSRSSSASRSPPTSRCCRCCA